MSVHQNAAPQAQAGRDVSSVVFGVAGVAITALALFAVIERNGGAPWPISSDGVLSFLSYHYQKIREALTYWWLPVLARWIGIEVAAWMKDVPAILGGIGFGLSAARRGAGAEVDAPLEWLLSNTPRLLQPIALCLTFAAAGLLFILAATIACAPVWVLLMLGNAGFEYAFGTEPPGELKLVVLLIGTVIGMLTLVTIVPRAVKLMEVYRSCGLLAAMALAYSLVTLGGLVAVDMLGVHLRWWGMP